MALVACRECGAQISDSAVSCPQCGVASPAGVATLVVSRRRQIALAGRAVSVFVNDMPRGKVKVGGSVNVHVAPGEHVVAVEGPHSSGQTTVSVSAGQTVKCEMWFGVFDRVKFAVG